MQDHFQLRVIDILQKFNVIAKLFELRFWLKRSLKIQSVNQVGKITYMILDKHKNESNYVLTCELMAVSKCSGDAGFSTSYNSYRSSNSQLPIDLSSSQELQTVYTSRLSCILFDSSRLWIYMMLRRSRAGDASYPSPRNPFCYFCSRILKVVFHAVYLFEDFQQLYL